MQRVTGGKALTETGRGRIRAAVGLPKWVSIRRRQTGGGGLAAGAMGYLPQGDCGKIRPNPLTSAVPLTWARGFGHRINQKRVAADAKSDGWQGAERNWPRPNPRRRRFTKMGRDPPPANRRWRPGRGSYRVSSPRRLRKNPPQPPTITILTNLTRARDLSKVLVYSQAPLIATYPIQRVCDGLGEIPSHGLCRRRHLA